ncbi:MAG TPA: hypothetical protein VNW68_05805 [Candidatus Limnocylindria bacterium]|nr:hypothetical protein [Candidatus Limnocylindria bacterium]
MLIGTACLSGSGPAETRHHLALFTKYGKLRSWFAARSDGDGAWEGCFPGGLFGGINGGDRIRVRAAGTEKTVKVPKLVLRIDRVADTISGRVAPGQAVTLLIVPGGFGIGGRDDPIIANAAGDGEGRYTARVRKQRDLRGADTVLAVTPPPCLEGVCELPPGTDSFQLLAGVPFVSIHFGSNELSGWSVNTQPSFKLFSPKGERKGGATTNNLIFGLYFAKMTNRFGNAAYPEARDIVTSDIASDARLVVPASRLQASYRSDTVSGRCMANARYLLTSSDSGLQTRGRTGADGTFTRDFGGKVNLLRGERVTLACAYPTGDLFQRTVATQR